MLTAVLLYIGVFVGLVLVGYFVLGFVAYVRYTPPNAAEQASNVRFVVTTIGSETTSSSPKSLPTRHRDTGR